MQHTMNGEARSQSQAIRVSSRVADHILPLRVNMDARLLGHDGEGGRSQSCRTSQGLDVGQKQFVRNGGPPVFEYSRVY